MSDLIPRRYLGDSVYAEIENGAVKLTTNNGYHDDPRNEIYLDPTAMAHLSLFYRDAQEAAKQLRKEALAETPEP